VLAKRGVGALGIAISNGDAASEHEQGGQPQRRHKRMYEYSHDRVIRWMIDECPAQFI
jgi:hypothetical protein